MNAAEEDDWDLGDAGGEFVDLTPPEKRRRSLAITVAVFYNVDY